MEKEKEDCARPGFLKLACDSRVLWEHLSKTQHLQLGCTSAKTALLPTDVTKNLILCPYVLYNLE
jgi:hypothetical protein